MTADPSFSHKLFSYLKEIISTSVPASTSPIDKLPTTYHPATIHHPQRQHGESKDAFQWQLLDNFHLLVEHCQRHKHSTTCYKYDPTHNKCRFDLDATNTVLVSTFNAETGEIHLKKLDGLVNNFDKVVIAAECCNMDIDFIGSGPETKAILFYVTDYIAKSQLPAHVTYAISEHVICKLDLLSNSDQDAVLKVKKLLCKCTNSLIAKQDLSAQQVSFHLLGHDAKYTSHELNNLYWLLFETYITNLTDVEDHPPIGEQMEYLDTEYRDIIVLTTNPQGQ